MNKLLLLSGNNIPFIGGKTTIIQPKIKEIAYIGQNNLFLGSNFLCFSKDNLDQKDKINLKNKTNFDILMSIINNKTNTAIKSNLISIELVLSLIFPGYQLKIMPNVLVMNRYIEGEDKKEQFLINNDNFEQLKSIISQIFCLSNFSGKKYNPANKMAQAIAKKLQDRQKKLNKKIEEEKKDIDILSRYISILVTGTGHTYLQLMEYTVYQLFDQFRRFEKKNVYDMWYQAKLAGAQNLENVDSWQSQDEQNIERMPKSNKIEF